MDERQKDTCVSTLMNVAGTLGDKTLDDKSNKTTCRDNGTNEQSVQEDIGTEEIEKSGNVKPKKPHLRWSLLAETLVMIAVLCALITVYFPWMKWIEESDMISIAEKTLTKQMVQFFFAGIIGVIARWLRRSVKDPPASHPGSIQNLVLWLSDAVGAALIVTVVMLIGRAFTIQVGTTAIALSDADPGLQLALAFVLAYYISKAENFLRGIADLFPKSEQINKVEE